MVNICTVVKYTAPKYHGTFYYNGGGDDDDDDAGDEDDSYDEDDNAPWQCDADELNMEEEEDIEVRGVSFLQQKEAGYGVEDGHHKEDETGSAIERLWVDGVKYDCSEHWT